MNIYSTEAEQSILGGIIRDNNAMERISLEPKDFYGINHQHIFSSMIAMYDKNMPLDVVTVSEYLQKEGHLEESGGLSYIGDLAVNTPSTSNIKSYAKIVKEKSVTRKLLAACSDTIADCNDGKSIDELLNVAEKRIYDINKDQVKDLKDCGAYDITKRTVKKIEQLIEAGGGLTGLSTGFTKFDEKTSGLQASDLIIIAARPSMGKTTLAMNLIENAVMAGELAIVFSMEMPAESLMMRMIASMGRIEHDHIRTGKMDDKEIKTLTNTACMLRSKDLYIDDTAALSPTEIRSRVRRIAKKKDAGIIMIDYMQLMKIPGMQNNRVGEVTEISRSLKSIAKEFKCPVVALSQLNRSLESRPNKRPIMSDLRDSGAIEQDADLIAFIYRDEVYNPCSGNTGIAEIIIGKQRNGPIGDFKLGFQGRYSRFENLAWRP